MLLAATWSKAAAQEVTADAEATAKLFKALTLHASFDKGLDADDAPGDKTCSIQQGAKLGPAKPDVEVDRVYQLKNGIRELYPLGQTKEIIGTIERLDPRFDKLIPKDAQLDKIADGYIWTEGAVWYKPGK
jgi:hypothetical protein